MPPPSKLPIIKLTPVQRAALNRIVNYSLADSFLLNRARVLLLVDELRHPLPARRIAQVAGVSAPTAMAILKNPEKALKAALGELPRRGNMIRRPALSPADRTALQRITKHLPLWTVLNKRARLLLLAADDPFPLRFNRLAKTAGVTRPTVYAVLRDPDASIRAVLRGGLHPRGPARHTAKPIKDRPRLTEVESESLDRLSNDMHEGARRRKQAKVLLMASQQAPVIGIEEICERLGMSPGPVRKTLNDANAMIRSLLGHAPRHPATIRLPVRGRPHAPYPVFRISPTMRAMLRKLTDNPFERAGVVKRARLLLAVENPGTRTRQGLAHQIGVDANLISVIFQQPDRALRSLLDHIQKRRTALRRRYGSALKPSRQSLALLHRIAGDNGVDELAAKRARVLLRAAREGDTMKITRVSATAGVAYRTARNILSNHEAVLSELAKVYKERRAEKAEKSGPSTNSKKASFARGRSVGTSSAGSNPGAKTVLARLESDLTEHPLVRARARAVLAAAGKELDREGKQSLARQLGMDFNFVRRSLMLFQTEGIAGLMLPGIKYSVK